ncbi:hypothetical protein KHU50_000694 [Colletotrichum sp. SAR 10_65]|nr:hypothetical protein KHU50_000694 [Colletotrichum sp. SAR 10_65]
MSPASSNTDATTTPANELDNLSAILEFRVKHAWRVNNQGKHEEAEEMAAKLLMEPALSSAKDAQRQALSDKSAADRKVAEELAAGKTMTDLHDDQMKELQKFEDDQSVEAHALAQGGDLPGGVGVSGVGGGGAGEGGGNQDSPEAIPTSSQNASETTARTSQGSALGRSQPNVAIEIEEYDMGDGTAPLPPIYSSDEDMI